MVHREKWVEMNLFNEVDILLKVNGGKEGWEKEEKGGKGSRRLPQVDIPERSLGKVPRNSRPLHSNCSLAKSFLFPPCFPGSANPYQLAPSFGFSSFNRGNLKISTCYGLENKQESLMF